MALASEDEALATLLDALLTTPAQDQDHSWFRSLTAATWDAGSSELIGECLAAKFKNKIPHEAEAALLVIIHLIENSAEVNPEFLQAIGSWKSGFVKLSSWVLEEQGFDRTENVRALASRVTREIDQIMPLLSSSHSIEAEDDLKTFGTDVLITTATQPSLEEIPAVSSAAPEDLSLGRIPSFEERLQETREAYDKYNVILSSTSPSKKPKVPKKKRKVAVKASAQKKVVVEIPPDRMVEILTSRANDSPAELEETAKNWDRRGISHRSQKDDLVDKFSVEATWKPQRSPQEDTNLLLVSKSSSE